MRLARIGEPGRERPAVLAEDGALFDATEVIGDYDAAFWDSGDAALRIALDCVVGPDDEVLIPRRSVKTNYEVELGVVIGRTARYVETTDDALVCVAGYTISHDVSEREFQIERTGTWDSGKSCVTFNPLGPLLVTADEIGDPQALGLRLWVNGELRQNGSTANMIFGVAELIRTVSQFMVLRLGDLINTGTPAGVALGKPDPKPHLRPGDVTELEIDGLGLQRQTLGQA